MRTLAEFFRLNILLPLAERVKGLRATYWFNQINKMNTWTKQQVIEWQNQQLRAFVRHAYEHTAYYKELFDQLNLTPDDIQTAEDLKKLPIITKDIIRKRFDDLVPDNVNSLPHREDSTGGTTGNPMKYYVSEDTWGYATAEKMVAWKTTSYKFGDKFVALGSASLFKQKPSLVRRIYDWIRQEIPLNSMSMSDEICQEYIDALSEEEQEEKTALIKRYYHDVEKEAVRRCILDEGIRLDRLSICWPNMRMKTKWTCRLSKGLLLLQRTSQPPIAR